MTSKRAYMVLAAGCVVMVVAVGAVVGLTTAYQVCHMQAEAAASVAEVSMRAVSTYEKALATYQANYEAAIAAGETPAVVVPSELSPETVAEQMGVDVAYIKQDADGTYVYLIQPGDTLSRLSAVFGYSVDALANFNEIRNVNLIYDGSALRIPSGQ